MVNKVPGFGDFLESTTNVLSGVKGRDESMVNTSDQAELQAAIRNAQNMMMEMGQIIDNLQAQPQKEQLKQLCDKTGTVLQEAQQRAESMF